MANVYVRTGIYEDGYFRVTRKLVPMTEEQFEKECKRLENYLIALEVSSKAIR